MSALPNSAQEQRSRMLECLRQRPVSTLEAGRELDILHPAARVMELRRDGYQIATIRTSERTDCGRLHRVARYLLNPTGGSLPLSASLEGGTQ